jgi:hypothetical protein
MIVLTDLNFLPFVKDSNVYFLSGIEGKNLEPCNQPEVSDLVCDLGLTKGNSELLGSRLKKKKLFSARNNLLLV